MKSHSVEMPLQNSNLFYFILSAKGLGKCVCYDRGSLYQGRGSSLYRGSLYPGSTVVHCWLSQKNICKCTGQRSISAFVMYYSKLDQKVNILFKC